MEKRFNQRKCRLVVTGPESTGKTAIARHLSGKYPSTLVPEYARDYIADLQRPYSYEDVVHIAETQIEEYQKFSSVKSGLIIFDTWLIITKVWFEVLYDRYPAWMDNAIHTLKIDLYLVCSPDIPWEPDEVRENGGEMRELLFRRYIDEIRLTGTPYRIIRGLGTQRYANAEHALTLFLEQ